MTGPNDSPPSGLQPILTKEQLAPGASMIETAVKPPKKVEELLVGVDGAIEQLRQNMLKIAKGESAPELPVKSGQLIEDLILNLRQANEHLVIASLEANIREAKAAEAHSRQTLFLSMLAHELRNPLAPIAMSVELLGKIPGTSAEVQTLQHILARQTTHLTRLVEDLMDATRINSGKIKIHKTSVLLSQLIAQAVETSQPLLDIHRQAVNLDIPHEPVWINGDVVRLTQLFSNLIINASKFSANESSIHISAKRDASSVVISVKDSGIGISPELQPFIFDLFMQGPAGDGLMASGLGIGLSLVQTIAKLHGGTVKVISQGIGHGSEFIVSLPVVVGSAAQMGQVAAQVTRASEPPEMHLISKRILLIDDNEDVNKTMSAFLMEAGHEVECALDGATGLRMERLQHHDVICCDIGLPGMDGYEVAKQLHQGSSRARLIAISGYDQPEQRDRALKTGFDHYLVKPIFGQELLELIELPENEVTR